jgi:hypothetical protein
MLKKIVLLALFFFLLNPGSSASGQLMGINPADYTKTTNGNQTFFTLNSGEVFFYSDNIYVIEKDANQSYFIKIPSDTTLKPCNTGNECMFAQENPPTEVFFGEDISGIILTGTINTQIPQKNSLNLIIQKDLNVFSGHAKIITSGSERINDDASLAGNITVRGTIHILENSSLALNANGGNGEDGSDGEAYSSSNYNGKDGKRGSRGREIKLEKVVLSDSASLVLTADGGSGGKGGSGANYYTDEGNVDTGTDGLLGEGGNAGTITIESLSVSGNSRIGVSAFKGEGLNYDSLVDGTVTIKGCNLKNLEFTLCQAGRLFVYSNDAVELMNSLNDVCVRPRTQIQPKSNDSCSEEAGAETTENSTKVIFSLTGTAKTFEGENLSGEVELFTLTREPESSEPPFIKRDTQAYSFSDGFFNFSFGENQLIFPGLSLSFGPFTYLLSFVVNTFSPESLSDSGRASLTLVDYRETE